MKQNMQFLFMTIVKIKLIYPQKGVNIVNPLTQKKVAVLSEEKLNKFWLPFIM